MKKFLIVLTLLLLISPVFAKTVQCVRNYQIYAGNPTDYVIVLFEREE